MAGKTKSAAPGSFRCHCQKHVSRGAAGAEIAEVVEVPAVGPFEPRPQIDRRGPAKPSEPADVGTFERGAVRLAGIEIYFAPKTHDVADETCEISDRNVFAGADVDVLLLRVVFGQKHD